MFIALVLFGVIWFIGMVGGVCTFLDEGLEDPKHYAIAVFWPIFLVIYLAKGLVNAVNEAIND